MAQKPSTDKYNKKDYSYVLGYNFGRGLVDNGVEVDYEQLIQALKLGLAKKESRFSQEESQQVMMSLNEVVRANKEKETAIQAKKNMTQANEFFKKNKIKSGVIETASGLQYEIIKKGDGAKPKNSDKVQVHYVGTLLDGREFDSSIRRGRPAEFGVGQVIAGWTEALQLMNVGSKYKLYIPSQLAYGEYSPPNSIIEPNAALVFEVELLAILP